MQKSGFLFLVLCFALTGCVNARKSPTWEKVRRVRVNTTEAADPSATYAQELHQVLQSASISHKVVTYQYRYTTMLREEAVGTRTAVIYRDDARRASPWWLADERVSRPVWLPEGDLNRQVRFYARRPSEVVEVRDFPAESDGKATASIKRQGSILKEPRREAHPAVANRDEGARPSRLSAIVSTITKPFHAFGRWVFRTR